MNIVELHRLSAADKLKVIEALWGDWIADEDSHPNLSWHETYRVETNRKFLSGDSETLDGQQHYVCNLNEDPNASLSMEVLTHRSHLCPRRYALRRNAAS